MNKFIGVCALFLSLTAFGGECDSWNLPEEQSELQQVNERIALYTDNMKAGALAAAVEPLEWLLVNNPDLHKSLYINGVKIYSRLAIAEADNGKSRAYRDRVAELYDARLSLCKGSGEVYNRKALDLYKLNRADKERYPLLLSAFNEAIEVNGAKTWINNLAAYMDIARRYHELGGLNDDQVISIYDSVISTLAESDDDDADETAAVVQKILISTIDMNCSVIEEKFVQAFLAKPNDLELGRKALGLSTSFNCTSSPSFIEIVKAYNKLEPKYILTKVIADNYVSEGDYAHAGLLYQEALAVAEDAEQLEQTYLKLAGIAFKESDRPRSKEYAQKALEVNPHSSEAYSLIGAIYMTSYEDCKRGMDKVKDRLVFLAAYEMYKMANDSEGMRSAQEQFPSREELFVQNYQTGESMRCDCWIGETVTLRTRD